MRGVWALVLFGVALWERSVSGKTTDYYVLIVIANVWAASSGLMRERR